MRLPQKYPRITLGLMFLPISIAQIPECGWFQPHGKNVKAVHAWGSPSSHFWRGCNICKKIEATRQPERTGAKLMPSEFHQEKIGNSTPERFFHVFPGLFLYVPIKKKTVPKFWTYHIPMGHWVQVLLFQPWDLVRTALRLVSWLYSIIRAGNREGI